MEATEATEALQERVRVAAPLVEVLETVGRRKPYTEIGISRVPCSRCGAPSRHQWQVCANGSRWVGVCVPCDLDLNRLALEFMKIAGAEELMAVYEESMT